MTTTPGSSRRPPTPPLAAAPAPGAPSTPPSAPRADETPDQPLLRALQAGDSRAWADLVTRYQDRLYATCLRMVSDRDAAADLTQDTFVKAIQHLGTFDGRSKLSTWLTRIAMNTCLSWQRSQRLRRHASLDTGTTETGEGGGKGGEFSDPGARFAASAAAGRNGHLAGQGWSGGAGRELGPHESVELSEQHSRVAAALATLGSEQRAILVLRDVQGLEYEQIAEVLQIAVGTVKSRLFRARLALREALEGGERAGDGGRGDQA